MYALFSFNIKHDLTVMIAVKYSVNSQHRVIISQATALWWHLIVWKSKSGIEINRIRNINFWK